MLIDLLSYKVPLLAGQGNAFFQRTSIPTLLIGVSMFFLAVGKKVSVNHTINNIASKTFGIYLFHISIVDALFNRLLPIGPFINKPLAVLVYIGVVTIVLFVLGLLVEMLRKEIEVHYQNGINYITERLKTLYAGILN